MDFNEYQVNALVTSNPLQADAAGSGQAEMFESPVAQLKHDG